MDVVKKINQNILNSPTQISKLPEDITINAIENYKIAFKEFSL